MNERTQQILTVRQRSCLLRAARQRLAQLHEDYVSADERGEIGSHREVVFAEINCVTAGIAWLWQQPAIDDGGG